MELQTRIELTQQTLAALLAVNTLRHVSWQKLMDDDCFIHRPRGTWQPCWKEVTE